jgi:pimeloyl-ACP methyl ester carboxylesterase/predicted glycosyltransferase
MRAIEPVAAGSVDRDGVAIAYEVFGSGARTIVFAPIDPVTTGRAWKAQVAYLARHARVVVIDPRGNGKSGRPTDPKAYADREFCADTLAVMDELTIDRAVLVGICSAVWPAVLLAVDHPERVVGLIAIAPWIPYLTPPHPHRAAHDFDAVLEHYEGWAKENRHYRLSDYRGYLEFFFDAVLTEPHSSKQWEDMVGWGLDSTPEIQNACDDGPISVEDAASSRAVLEQVDCPVLVIHGDEDACQPPQRAVIMAEVTGAELLTLVGAGHVLIGREPVAVNLAVRGFLDRVWPVPSTHRWSVPVRRERAVLYLSSPIGLGHSRRDLAIVGELRRQRPEVRVDWLAQAPLTDWLTRRGESVHPASRWLASEVAHIDSVAGEHDLHAFQAIREMDEILVANFMVFRDVVDSEHYDLWVGDEAWELDHFLYENPELKRSAYAWLTDFVGWLPMPDDTPRTAHLTADYNAEMLEHVARLPRIRDRAIFVGDEEDVVGGTFGPDLPSIRDWTRSHYSFAGYVTGFAADEIADREALRAEFGFGPEPVCVVAVGGSGVGRHLLTRAVEAFPLAAERCAGLRMVVVTGPRIDPASLPTVPGVEVHGWLPDLHRRLAAADVALVQGGLTTTMELTAAGRPFVYVPLRNHFEQNIHVRHRLERHGAGRCVEWPDATPERLAKELTTLIGSPTDYRPVDRDGAQRTASLLAELI